MPLGSHSIVIQDREPVVALVDAEVVMLSARAEAYFALDSVGTEIWNMIEKPCRICDISTRLIERYDVAPTTCEIDLLKFLNDLLGEDLIKIVDEEERS